MSAPKQNVLGLFFFLLIKVPLLTQLGVSY